MLLRMCSPAAPRQDLNEGMQDVPTHVSTTGLSRGLMAAKVGKVVAIYPYQQHILQAFVEQLLGPGWSNKVLPPSPKLPPV